MKRNNKMKFSGKKKFFKLRVSITDICNLSCKHCFAKDHAKHMNYNLFKKAVDDLYDLNGKGSIISYMGGEPMVYPKIVESVYYITEKGMKVSLTTNGYHSDIIKLREIKKAGDVILAVSLDGPEAFHNENRGKPDSYKDAIKTIEAISEFQNLVVISLPFFKQTPVFFDFFNTLLDKYKCMLRFSRFVPVGRGRDITGNAPGIEEYKALFRFAEEWNSRPGYLRVDVVDPFFIHPNRGMRSCKCGKKIAFVNTDGEVWPCWRMQLPIGDLNYQTLADILKNPIIDEYLDVSKLKGKCAVCANKPICKGGCHAVPYALNGDYHRADPHCPYFSAVPAYT